MRLFVHTARMTWRMPRSARGLWRAWYWMGKAAREGVAYLDVSTALVYR